MTVSGPFNRECMLTRIDNAVGHFGHMGTASTCSRFQFKKPPIMQGIVNACTASSLGRSSYMRLEHQSMKLISSCSSAVPSIEHLLFSNGCEIYELCCAANHYQAQYNKTRADLRI